jgi:hypothetical protein
MFEKDVEKRLLFEVEKQYYPMAKWNVGKMMSDNYEQIEVYKDILHGFKTEDELSKYLDRKDVTEFQAMLQDTKKGPLGSEFLRRTYTPADPLVLVLTTHLIIEILLNEIIKKKFQNSAIILDDFSFSKFSSKIKILRAKNYLDEKLYSDLVLLNNVRNKFGHTLFYDIGEFDMSKFYYWDGLYEGFENLSKITRKKLNIYVYRIVMYFLLFRITQKNLFVAEIKE